MVENVPEQIQIYNYCYEIIVNNSSNSILKYCGHNGLMWLPKISLDSFESLGRAGGQSYLIFQIKLIRRISPRYVCNDNFIITYTISIGKLKTYPKLIKVHN